MTVLGVFGIDNGAVNTVVNLLILVLVVLWFALVYWTYADARRRIADPMLIACATCASLFPFVGTLVYLKLRSLRRTRNSGRGEMRRYAPWGEPLGSRDTKYDSQAMSMRSGVSCAGRPRKRAVSVSCSRMSRG